MRALLWASSALAVFLAFAWPFVVSGDPASAAYQTLAIAALIGILAPILGLVLRKSLKVRRS